MAKTKIDTQQVTDPVVSSSMSRQAIMNGNFDVWQRGTSFVIPSATTTYNADRWNGYFAPDGGTNPTITLSRQILTSGDLNNSFYYLRTNTNGAGTSLGNASIGIFADQRIEFGSRFLCGASKKVTISFWARSDIGSKRIGIFAVQLYGTGGSPTANENIFGTNWTLTSSWTKYTHTFTTNTLVGKTFGTNNNDSFEISLCNEWGSTLQSYVGASSSETYGGSGNVDLAQVQICSGDVALPFQPKSFNQELLDCQRYFWQVNNGMPLDAATHVATCLANATTGANCMIHLPVSMRVPPTALTATASDWRLILPSTALYDCTSIGFEVASVHMVEFIVGVASGLVADKPYYLQSDASTGRVMQFSAEL